MAANYAGGPFMCAAAKNMCSVVSSSASGSDLGGIGECLSCS